MCAAAVCVFLRGGWTKEDEGYALITAHPLSPIPSVSFSPRPVQFFFLLSSPPPLHVLDQPDCLLGRKRANTSHLPPFSHLFFFCVTLHTPCVSAMRAEEGVERQRDV